jgi:type III pantothenate kinase
MILCLDVGNSHIFGGVFQNNQLLFSFRYPSKEGHTSDKLGIFLKNVIRENRYDPDQIEKIAICSVVPTVDYSITSACLKYFSVEPFFLKAGVKTGLKINIAHPAEIGSDRIANAVAACQHFPNQNILLIDFGTATTFCAISKRKEYLGGVILTGLGVSMEALHQNAAKLSPVNIIKPEEVLGLNTVGNIQSGLYYGHLGAIREIKRGIMKEAFANQEPVVIGTGGFAYLFEAENIFTAIISDLVLQGLCLTLDLNRSSHEKS